MRPTPTLRIKNAKSTYFVIPFIIFGGSVTFLPLFLTGKLSLPTHTLLHHNYSNIINRIIHRHKDRGCSGNSSLVTPNPSEWRVLSTWLPSKMKSRINQPLSNTAAATIFTNAGTSSDASPITLNATGFEVLFFYESLVQLSIATLKKFTFQAFLEVNGSGNDSLKV